MSTQVTCPECGKPFPDGFALIVHRRMKHAKEFLAWELAERAKVKERMDEDARRQRGERS